MAVGFDTTTIDIIELPPKLPGDLPGAYDDCSLAFHLGFRNKILWWIIRDSSQHFKVVKIPKKTGGCRIIHDPAPVAKLMLKRFLLKFLAPLQDQLGSHVSAYRKGMSVRDAVAKHVPACDVCDGAPQGQTPPKHDCPRLGVYIHMDLKDFFPSTSRAWVRRYFKNLGYSHEVAGYIAALTTVRDIPNPRYAQEVKIDPEARKFFAGVPQGSPASGALCNLVADQRLDAPVMAYLETLNARHNLEGERRWVYSRYSDDLTLTCGANLPEKERTAVVKELATIIRKSGYKLNKKKTRVSFGYYRKTLLGMVFNQKPNYPKEKYYALRAIVYNCKVHGFETQYQRAGKDDVDSFVAWLRGKINWVNQINPDKGAKLLLEFDAAQALHLPPEVPNDPETA